MSTASRPPLHRPAPASPSLLKNHESTTEAPAAAYTAPPSPSARFKLKDVLAIVRSGVELYTAADGDEALAAITAQQPDLVFLDVMMPGRSGLDVTRAVRADPSISGAHIVLLTAKGQAQDQEAGLAAGADQYLTKPFDPDALLAIARTVLGPE